MDAPARNGPHSAAQRLKAVHLYCFTPGDLLKDRDPMAVVAAQIRGGADVIQLREKGRSRRERLKIVP